MISNLAQREDGRIVALDGVPCSPYPERINILHSQRLRANLPKDTGMQWEETAKHEQPEQESVGACWYQR